MNVMPITDSLFLEAELRDRPLHVGGLHLYRPPADAGPDVVGDTYREALAGGEVMPRLRRRPVRLAGLGPWGWEEDTDLDLEYHVRHSALPHPGRVRELLALVSRLHGTLLDRSRPLWEAHLIEGLSDGRFAVYTKIHHALVDGVSAMHMLQNALSEDPDQRGSPPLWAPRGAAPRGRRRATRVAALSRPSPAALTASLRGTVDAAKAVDRLQRGGRAGVVAIVLRSGDGAAVPGAAVDAERADQQLAAVRGGLLVAGAGAGGAQGHRRDAQRRRDGDVLGGAARAT